MNPIIHMIYIVKLMSMVNQTFATVSEFVL
jgi:hypothetical protein